MTQTSVNGIDLHHQELGQGEPLLLLHGYTGSGADWEHAGRDQLAAHHRLIIPDLRGHGRSSNPGRTITHRQCALDALALLDALGLARCKAIGLSMGANTLLHLAAAQPHRLEAMVIVSATTHYPEATRAMIDQLNAGREQQLDSGPGDRLTTADLGRITARTLIVYGDRDPLYPVEIGVDLYRGIPGSALWLVPGGGHGPIFGDQRDQFVAGALAFLA